MTLVPSRRLLLNGNKFFILSAFLFLISSCGSRNISSLQKTEVVPIEKNTTKAQEDSVSRKPQVFDIDLGTPEKPGTSTPTTTPATTTPVKQSGMYNIAVILPFFLDQIPLGMYADDSTKQLTGDSKIALAFYTGCKMAHEKFVNSTLNANVYFVDDQDDSLTTANLFLQKPFPNVDYIVGPLSFNNIKIAADLAKARKIPLFSPFANSMYIKDNPYYFNAFPTLKTQYAFLLDKAKVKFPEKTIEVIYDGEDPLAENISILKEIANGSVKYNSLQVTDDVLKTMYSNDTISERVILIYSSKEPYIKSMIAKLRPLKNHLQIFTSAIAKNIKPLTDSKNSNAIYTTYPFNTDGANYTLFSDKFEERTKRKPEEAVAMGYDMMMHLFNMLNKKQAPEDNTYNTTTDFDNLQTRFIFKPSLNKNGGIDYYDNTFLYLYKYVNGSFIISTP